MPSPLSLPRAKSFSPPQSPPPEEMTQQDWEVFEIKYQWAEERYESFQKKLYDLIGDRKSWEISEEHKELEEIIDNDIENKY